MLLIYSQRHLMLAVMNLELKLVVANVSTAEQKLVLNGCLDWNETSANDEIQAYTYYYQLKIIDFLNASYVKYALTVNPTVYTSCIEQLWAITKVTNINGEAQIQALVDKKKVIITEASIRRDLRFKDEGGVDCLSNEAIFEQLTLIGSIMAFAIICLAINQKFNFSNYIFDNMMMHLDGGVKFLMYPRFVKVFANMKKGGNDFSGKVKPLFETMMVQAPEVMGKGLKIPTDPHHTPIVTQPSSSPPQKKQKSRRKQRKEIEVLSPSSEIPNEERLPTTLRIHYLVKRKLRTSGLKRLRKVRSARRVESSTEASLGDQEDASKQERMIDNIDQDVEITLVDDTQGRMNEEYMLRVNDLDSDEVVMDVSASDKVEQSVKVVKKEVSTTDPVTTAGEVVTTAGIEVTTAATTSQLSKDELALAHTLIEIKAAKPKAITTAATIVTVAIIVTAAGTMLKEKAITKDKGKDKMSKPEKHLKRKDQVMIDEEVAKNLEAQMQTELEEEERLARRKEEENNIALIESWDNTQAMMDADCELVTRLQEEERGELSIEEKSRVVKGSDKAVEGSEKAKEGSSKRVAGKLEPGDAKRQKIKEENESAKLKRCLEIILKDDDDVKMEATPLPSKYQTIVDYKIYKEGRKNFFKIIRKDGNSQNYLTFGKMFKNINREDLKVLWSIVKERFKKTKPIDDMENLLFQTLNTMFEHHVEDNIWKYQQGSAKILNWKLFDSCGVYCVTTNNMVYYLLVKKMYLFTRNILH
nr:hypothetical protein [Tanacetum cinerariifolium]